MGVLVEISCIIDDISNGCRDRICYHVDDNPVPKLASRISLIVPNPSMFNINYRIGIPTITRNLKR